MVVMSASPAPDVWLVEMEARPLHWQADALARMRMYGPAQADLVMSVHCSLSLYDSALLGGWQLPYASFLAEHHSKWLASTETL